MIMPCRRLYLAPPNARVVSLDSADFDNDGKLDILYCGSKHPLYSHPDNEDTLQISQAIQGQVFDVLTGFSPAPSHEFYGFTNCIAADLNSDGKPDVVAVGRTSQTLIWRANTNSIVGTIAFSSAGLITIGTGILDATSLIAADFTRDGRPDLAVAARGDSAVLLFRSSGAGTFSAKETLTSSATRVMGVAGADITGDGWPELVFVCMNASSTPGSLGFFVNVGSTQTFPASQFISSPVAVCETCFASRAASLVAVDMTSDTLADIVAVFDSDVYFYENDNAGSVLDAVLISEGVAAGNDVNVVDVNLDGLLDVILPAGSNLYVLMNYGFSAFGPSPIVLAAAKTGTYMDTRFLDSAVMDWCDRYYACSGDGVNELVVAMDYVGVEGSEGRWRAVSAVPFFPDVYQITSRFLLRSVTSIAIGDLNNDLMLDIVTAESPSDDIAFYAGSKTSPGISSFAFASRRPLASFQNPLLVAVADMNNDANLDVVGARAPGYDDTPAISIFLGAGDGTVYRVVAVYASANRPVDELYWKALLLRDCTGDGFIDVLAHGIFFDSIYLFTSSSNGFAWTEKRPISIPDKNTRVQTFDAGLVNGDAMADVVLNDFTKIVLFLATGSGNYDSGTTLVSTTSALSLVLADVTQDNRLDVVWTTTSNNLVYIASTGTGTFNTTIVTLASSNSGGAMNNSLRAADLNNDDRIDFIMARPGDSSVIVHSFVYGTLPSNYKVTTSAAPAIWHAIGDLDNNGYSLY